MWTRMISPAVAAWMRPRIDFSALDADFAARVQTFLDGKTAFTADELSFLSELTHVPYGFFFLSEPPEEDDVLLLGWDGFPSRAVVATLYQMQRRQDVASDALRHMMERPAWADVHEPDMRFLHDLPPDADLSDLTELIEEQDVLVMQGSAVHGDPDWQLDPAECSMIALYDSCVPLIFLNSRAVGKEQLLLRAYTVLVWGQNDIASWQRRSPTEYMTCGDLESHLRGIPDGPVPEDEYIPLRFWQLLRHEYERGTVQPTEAGRLTNRTWAQALEMFEKLRRQEQASGRK